MVPFRRALTCLCLTSSLAACGGGDAKPGLVAISDAAAVDGSVDAGVAKDSLAVVDAVAAVDDGNVVDVAPIVDSMVAVDVGAAVDAAPAVDSMAVVDAGAAVDAGAVVDTSNADAGATADASSGCGTGANSSLSGAQITFAKQPCTFTLAQAKAGIEIHYKLQVSKDINDVVAKPQDGGNCGQPSALGLILFERLSGGGQNHCLCDTGMCMPPSKTGKTIKAGEQPGTFKWDGVNWTGPSDFGNPKGKAFPVGSYTLAVSAKGMIGSGAVSTPFEVLGTMVITLVP